MSGARIGFVDVDATAVRWVDGDVPQLAREVLALLGMEAPGGPDGHTDASRLAATLASVAPAVGLTCAREIVVVAHMNGAGHVTPLPAEVGAVSRALASCPDALIVTGDRLRAGKAAAPACDAEDLRATRRAGPVRGVASLSEALDAALGFHDAAQQGRLLGDSATRERAVGAVFAAVLANAPLVLDWRTIAAVALGHLRRTDLDAATIWELEFIYDVVRRHDGASAPMDWPAPPVLDRYAEDERFQILAHVVQSAADGDLHAVQDYVSRALEAVSNTRTPAALKTLGACGRALAAVGRYDEATDRLEGTVDAWLTVDPAQGSYSLCELLRVLGIAGDRPRLDALAAGAVRSVLAASRPEGVAFVTLAIGRALAQANAPATALEWLESTGDPGPAPPHVESSRARWLAYAGRALGDRVRVAKAMAELRTLRGGETDQRWLAELDEAVASAADLAAPLAALLALPSEGEEARRALTRLAPGMSARTVAARPRVVEALLREYRY